MFSDVGKQVSPLTIFTALWLYKLHTGPLVPAVKVKRHEIKSDPTPLGFEGRSISILHENLVWYFSLNSHLITAGGWHWSSLGGWGQFICITGIKTACYSFACPLHPYSPRHGPDLSPSSLPVLRSKALDCHLDLDFLHGSASLHREQQQGAKGLFFTFICSLATCIPLPLLVSTLHERSRNHMHEDYRGG